MVPGTSWTFNRVLEACHFASFYYCGQKLQQSKEGLPAWNMGVATHYEPLNKNQQSLSVPVGG